MKHEDLFKLHEEMCAKALAKMRKKSVDYSGGNRDALINFKSSLELGVEPELGLMTRLKDKMMRVASFIKNGILQVEDETVLDTLIDSINYPILCMGLIMDRKQSIGIIVDSKYNCIVENNQITSATKYHIT